MPTINPVGLCISLVGYEILQSYRLPPTPPANLLFLKCFPNWSDVIIYLIAQTPNSFLLPWESNPKANCLGSTTEIHCKDGHISQSFLFPAEYKNPTISCLDTWFSYTCFYSPISTKQPYYFKLSSCVRKIPINPTYSVLNCFSHFASDHSFPCSFCHSMSTFFCPPSTLPSCGFALLVPSAQTIHFGYSILSSISLFNLYSNVTSKKSPFLMASEYSSAS